MEQTTQDLVERVKNITEDDANSIIKEFRKVKIKNSVTLESFVADYLNSGRYCIVNNDESGACIPCEHRELLINFLLNLDALRTETDTLVDRLAKKILDTRTSTR